MIGKNQQKWRRSIACIMLCILTGCASGETADMQSGQQCAQQAEQQTGQQAEQQTGQQEEQQIGQQTEQQPAEHIESAEKGVLYVAGNDMAYQVDETGSIVARREIPSYSEEYGYVHAYGK